MLQFPEVAWMSQLPEVAWMSQFPFDLEQLLPPWTHLQVVRGRTRRADGVKMVG
jgi:hypothetical protein